MSKRIDKSWIVYVSVENFEHDRCVDFFWRPDGTYGFEEFRRDPEDAGRWTPVTDFSSIAFPAAAEAMVAACKRVPWLSTALDESQSTRRAITSFATKSTCAGRQ
jgi:hypothetical protein